MTEPAKHVSLKGEVAHRADGEGRLEAPGDAVIVRRGVLRSLLMACPDGCGETLAVNLDPRMAQAWRLDLRKGVTLYPSVWRQDGCNSHFIVWKGQILWCDRFDPYEPEPPYDAGLEDRVYGVLEPHRFSASEDVAAQLDEIPWDVSRAGHALVRKGLAVRGVGADHDSFRRSPSSERL